MYRRRTEEYRRAGGRKEDCPAPTKVYAPRAIGRYGHSTFLHRSQREVWETRDAAGGRDRLMVAQGDTVL